MNQTDNYGLKIPNVEGFNNLWHLFLNENFQKLDAIIKQNQSALEASLITNTNDVKYNEIVKDLAQNQKLFLIIASSDYIYGTNYQFYFI